jgi:hypothetical protein
MLHKINQDLDGFGLTVATGENMRNRHLRRPLLPPIFSAKLVAHLILVSGTYGLYKILIGEGFAESKIL